MKGRRLARLTTLASVLFAFSVCGAEVPDRLVLRDGAEIECRVQTYGGGTFLVERDGSPASFQRAQVASVLFDVARGEPETHPPTTQAGDRIYLRNGDVVSSRLTAIDASSVRTATRTFGRDEVYRIDLAVPGGPTGPIALPGLPGDEEVPQMCWMGRIDYEGTGSWKIGNRSEDGTCHGYDNDPDMYLHPKLETHVEGVFVESIYPSMTAPVPPPPLLDCTRGPCFLVPRDVRFKVTYEHETRPSCTGRPYTPRWSFRRTGKLKELLGLGAPEHVVGAGIIIFRQDDAGPASYWVGRFLYGPLLGYTLAFGWEVLPEKSPAVPFRNANIEGEFDIGRRDGGDTAAPRRLEAGGTRIRGRFEWSEHQPETRRREKVRVDWDFQRRSCRELSAE